MRGPNWLALLALMAANLVVGTVAATVGTIIAMLIGAFARGEPVTLPRGNTGEELGAVDAAIEIVRNCADTVVITARGLYPDSPEAAAGLAVVAVAVIGPAMIAAPALRSTPPTPRGRSMRASVAGAAVLGGACVLGVIATAWDVLGLAATPAPTEPTQLLRGGGLVMVPWLLVPAWVVAGTIWALLIRRAGLAARPDGLDRMVRRVFAGTCVELAIAAPTLVVATRRGDCYCSWGSWWAIVAGITSLGLLCGPAIVLIATRRTRMQWMRGVCLECGYPLRGVGTCPECGKSVPG
jgi:hypothetical protein